MIGTDGSLGHARAWEPTVTDALLSLPHRQAEALRLIYRQRKTQAEVAKILGTTSEETKQIVSAAIRTLARRLCTT